MLNFVEKIHELSFQVVALDEKMAALVRQFHDEIEIRDDDLALLKRNSRLGFKPHQGWVCGDETV